MVMIMQGMENVTVMGFTESNGSAQGVSSPVELKSGMLAFPTSLMLDENHDIFVDSGTDHESRNDIDIRIPFDENAVEKIFVENQDYVLEKALELLNN